MGNNFVLFFWIGIIMNRKLTKFEIWLKNFPIEVRVILAILTLFVLGLLTYVIIEKGFQADDEMETTRTTQFMEQTKGE